MMIFKDKRLSQAEAAKNYKLCEQVTEEIMNLKCRNRELVNEEHLFNQKEKRCLRRKKAIPNTSSDGGSSNSRCESPQLIPPECIGSRINPVTCDSPGTSADSTHSPLSITSDSSLN